MPDFNPSPHDRVVIGGLRYQVMPHPAVPTFAFGQEGRKAFVYQLAGGPDSGLYALKKFKQAFRLEELVGICDQLARFSQWQGLEVADRVCLHHPKHADALDRWPDLEYAVLMPWIGGTTWYDMVIGMTALTRLEALSFARATAQVLAAIEEAGLAHCDISASNVIINPTTGRAHLIDIEDLYAPSFDPPAALPAGTDGYAHSTASGGLWCAEADRFAGAVIVAEMAAWHDPRIRKQAEEEHYFSPSEMQQDCPRYRLMREVLADLDAQLAELFDLAWFSQTLADCPRLSEWQEVINRVHHSVEVAGVVTAWRPLAAPGVEPAAEPAAEPRPIQPPPAAPAVSEQEPPPIVPQFTPQISPRPAPGTPVIQPTLPPAPATGPAAAPIRIQPSQQPGGPVREWRPISAPPSVTPPPAAAPAGRIPIWQPPAEAEEAPVEAAPPEEDAPFDGEDGAGWAPEPVEPDAAEWAYEDVYAEEVEAAPLDAVSAPGLLKPILDLSYVDERNRPHLVWTESPGATHYLLQEDADPAFPAPKEHRIRAADTRWSPGLLWRRSGRLHFRIRAEDGDSAGPWSETLIVRLGR